MKDFYRKKIIIITGGAGSIGTELVFQIQKLNPKKIIILDNSEYGIHKLKRNPSYNEKISKVILIDIKDFIHLKAVFNSENPNIIIHTAAYKHLPILQENPSDAILTNVMATKNLVNLCKEIDVERFLFVSTDKAVSPSSILGVSKYLAERIISYQKDLKTKFYTVRFGNIYKSSGSVTEVFEDQIKTNSEITITDMNVKRFFMNIKEACFLLLNTLTIENKNSIFIFEMEPAKKIIEIALEVAASKNLKLNEDIIVNVIGLREGEKLEEILLNGCDFIKRTKHQNILEVIETSKPNISLEKINQLIDLAKQRNELKVLSEINKIINICSR